MRKWGDPDWLEEVNDATRLPAPKAPAHGPRPLLVLLVLGLGLGLLGISGLFTTPQPEAPLRIEGPIVDAETGLPVEADVYLDGRLLYERVRQVSVRVPSGSELRIVAEGYAPWAFRFRYELKGSYRFHGPIRLTRLTKAGEE